MSEVKSSYNPARALIESENYKIDQTFEIPKQNMRYIGKETKRIKGDEIVTGKLRYTGDFTLPMMQYGKVLRSPIPFGRIVSINAEKAKALPGVQRMPVRVNSSVTKASSSSQPRGVFAQTNIVPLASGTSQPAAVKLWQSASRRRWYSAR